MNKRLLLVKATRGLLCAFTAVLSLGLGFGEEIPLSNILKKLASNDLSGAIEAATLQLEVTPEDPYVLTARGTARLTAHEYRLAISDFQKAIEIEPLLYGAVVGELKAQVALGERIETSDDIDRSSELFETGKNLPLEIMNRKIEADPSDERLRYRRASYLSSVRKDYEGAIKDFEKYLELQPNPKNSMVFKMKATAEKRVGRIDDAIDTLKKSQALFPEAMSDIEELESLLRQVGRVGEADAVGARLVEMKIVDKMRYLKMFQGQVEQGRSEEYARKRIAEIEEKLLILKNQREEIKTRISDSRDRDR